MSIIYILIPIAILLTSLAIYLFFWAVKTEQFEDLEKQGMSILFDDEPQIKNIAAQPEQKEEEEIKSAKKSINNQ
jgi:cbb3-type cytochrome oxidase maturation protein|tara:strand:+ start:199 stop:423 length:225 start_codon:yes stop_codon:yes gene_type:complete